MKKLFLSLAAIVSFGVSVQAAGPLGGAVPVTVAHSGDSLPSVGAEHKYGLLPFLRRGIWWRPNAGACAGCGQTAPYGAPYAAGAYGPTMPGAGIPGIPQPSLPGAGMPGTLVFPNHPFMRSPRDFFMYEKN